MISLPGLLERGARINRTATATRFLDRERSWSQVLNRVSRLAAGLSGYNLEEADRIAILSLNSDNYFESIFAVPWAGFCLVPLNTRWALPENQYALVDSGSKVLLFDDAFIDQARLLKDQVDSLQQLVYMGDNETPDWADSYEELVAQHQPAPMSRRGDDDMAGIFYTGGTTGFPKGVMQSHKAIWASAIGMFPSVGMNQTHCYLHAAPMFHMADFAGSMNALLAGGSHAFVAGFDAGLVLKIFSDWKVTHTLIVPAMVKMLLAHPDAGKADLSRLEKITYGASPMPAALLSDAMRLWPQVGFTQAYGQTEMAPVITTLNAEDHRKGGDILKSAGRPTPVSEVRLLDSDDNDVELGVQGEVVVKGPHAMLGYWNKPDETAKALVDGWVYTGDAGIFDASGYLYIVDRVKDMIITGGENVFTTEVENALISHDAVQDVAVIGIPHDEWGEMVHGIVILVAGMEVSEAALIGHCRKSIAGYKCPKSISFREQPLPLSGAGKVLKTELRAPFWKGRNRQVN